MGAGVFLGLVQGPVPPVLRALSGPADGSLAVCQDTDSDYSLIRVHRLRLAQDIGPGPAAASLKFDVSQALFREQIECTP